MPVRLEAPQHRPGGPDGQGWNRLSLNAHLGADRAQCALRPRSYAALRESQDTRRAGWGGFGPCDQDRASCTGCPRLTARPKTLRAFGDRVLVRLWERASTENGPAVQHPAPQPWLMDRPEEGWGSTGYPWTWSELARLAGWRIGRPYRDEHSDGFWLIKVNPARYDGLPDCTHGYLNRDHCPTCVRELDGAA